VEFARVEQTLPDKLIERRRHNCENGDDLPEIREWRWKAWIGIELPAEN
jgi:phosphoketolase